MISQRGPRRWAKRLSAVGLSAVLAFGLTAPALPANADPGFPRDTGNGTAAGTVTAQAAPSAPVNTPSDVQGNVSGFAGPVTVSTQVKINGQWSTSQSVSGVTGTYKLPLTYGSSQTGARQWRVVAQGGGQRAEKEFTFRRYGINVSSAGVKGVGEATNAWGTVSGFGGPVTVSLQAYVNGRWSTSRTATNVTGSYVLPITYGINSAGKYQFRVVASRSGETAIKTFTFTRKANTSVTAASASTKYVPEVGNAWGNVSGFGGPATITSQVLVGGKWLTSQTVTGVTGAYSVPLTYGANTPGTYTFRIVASRPGMPSAYSQNLTVKRVAKPVTGLDSRCLTGRAMCISKGQRKLYWVVNGQVQMSFDVRFGSELTPTRNGAFQVNWKSRNHVSSLYHTPMPYAMFFSGGQAVHYSADFAARGYNGASHGCVNVRDKVKIAKLFDLVRVGDKVIVYTG